MEAVTFAEFYVAPLQLIAFIGGWLVSMVTGLMFKAAF